MYGRWDYCWMYSLGNAFVGIFHLLSILSVSPSPVSGIQTFIASRGDVAVILYLQKYP